MSANGPTTTLPVELLLVLVAGLSAVSALPVDAQESPNGRLVLDSGRELIGRLPSIPQDPTVGDPSEQVLLWRPLFLSEPTPYPLSCIQSMTLSKPAPFDGSFDAPCRVTLTTDEVVLGTVVDLGDGHLTLSTPRCELLRIPLGSVVSIERGLDDMSTDSPGDLAEWSDLAPGSRAKWSSRFGTLRTQEGGSVLWRDLGLTEPRQFRIALQTLGTDRAFRLVFGVSELEGWLFEGVFIETWGERVVVYRELDHTLEVYTLGRTPLSGWLQLDVFWNPEQDEAEITYGDTTVTISLPEDPEPGLAIETFAGGMVIERMSCRRPHTGEGARRRLAWNDVAGFDVDTRSIWLRREPGAGAADPTAAPIRIPWEEVGSLTFRSEAVGPIASGGGGEVIVSFVEGTRMAGEYLGWDGRSLRMRPVWSATALRLSLAGLTELEFPEQKRIRWRFGAAKLNGNREHSGDLMGWDAQSESFLWRPVAASGVAPLASGFSGSIHLASESEFYVSRRKAPHQFYLFNGDLIPGRLIRAIGDEVTLWTPLGGEQTLAGSLIQAIEMRPDRCRDLIKADPDSSSNPQQFRRWGAMEPQAVDPAVIDKKRRERILHLPRKLLKQPPTHIVVADNGDMVRGRLISLDPNVLRIATGLREIVLPAAKVAAVVRLQALPEPLDTDPLEGSATDVTADVILVLNDRTRFRLEPSTLQDGVISGDATVGTEISIDVNWIERIELGERGPADSPYTHWVLEPMKGPG